jgi:hypothetical protein
MAGSDINPYTSPESSIPYAPEADEEMVRGIYRHDDLLIVQRRSAAYVPRDSCFKCGRPAVTAVRRKLHWHHPSIYLWLALWIVPYLILAVFARKKLAINVGLCARHAAVRRWLFVAVWVTIPLGITLLVTGIVYDLEIGNFRAKEAAPFLVVLSFGLAFAASNGPGRARCITDKEGIIAGAGEGYLRRFSKGITIAPPEPPRDNLQAKDTETGASAGACESRGNAS